jgi:bifunctional enzyme CysN/CysC
MEHLAAKTLELNAIGVAESLPPTSPSFSNPMPTSRALGGFILIDKITNRTVGAGMLHFSAAPRAKCPLASN